MNHDPAEIIRKALVDGALGVEPTVASPPDWSVYDGFLPDDPDRVIVVQETTGRIGGRTSEGVREEHPGFQVRVRGKTNSETRQKAEAIALFFDGTILRTEVTIGSDVYLIQAVTRTGGLSNLGREEKSRRYGYTLNAVLTVKQTT